MQVSPSTSRFLRPDELQSLGLARVGRDVLIDRDVRFLRPETIEIGDRSRIDMGVVISGGDAGVQIGCNVHLGTNSLIFGSGGRVVIGDFSGFSSQVACYASTDDYLGDYLFGPTVPDRYRNVQSGSVILEPCVLIGVGCVLLPGITLGEGVVCGAHTVVTKDIASGDVVVGHPARRISRRNVAALRALRRSYLESIGEHSLASEIEIEG